MKYTVLTEDDRKLMLEKIGVASVDELFSDLPKDIILDKIEGLPCAASEMEITDIVKKISAKNKPESSASFCGGGCYNHYIPAAVDELAGRGEFYTAYTPYQPEVSQGTLTAIFEYQSYMCRLTDMDVSNASLYDGATALAEAVIMSAKAGKKKKVLVSRSVNPFYRETLATYAWASNIEIAEIPLSGIVTDTAAAEKMCDSDTAAVVVQSPNFFGYIEPVEELTAFKEAKKIDLIYVVAEALSLALLKTPAARGADIVCGEAQSFGNYPGFGGPMLGFITAKEKFTRKMPGRFVGLTVDQVGNQAFALTLQAREQHIRREKATSNICSNEGLLALRAAIYLGLTGPKLPEIASCNHNAAAYLCEKLLEIGFKNVQGTSSFDGAFFNEFMLDNSNSKFSSEKFSAGIDAGKYYPEFKNCTIFCATERNTKESIDALVEKIKAGC